MKRTLLLMLILLAIFGRIPPPPSAAQSCPTESEPNDEPASGNVIESCISGTIFDGDQDLYWFEASSASRLYPITLSGIPNGSTELQIYQPVFDDDGDITNLQTYGSLSVSNGASDTTPAIALQPGRYLLGISSIGDSGAYQLTIEQDAFAGTSENEPNDDRETAAPISAGNAILGTV